MSSMHNIKRATTLILVSLTTFGAQAAGTYDKSFSRYPPIKKEQPRPVSVTEPGMFALLGIGLGALGLRAFLRRHKDE